MDAAAAAASNESLTRLPAELPASLRHLRPAALLGYGAFAQVLEVADDRDGGRRYALKVVEKEPLAARGMLSQLAFEFGVQRSMHHPQIVGALELAEDASHAYMLLELCPGGSLWSAVQRFPRNVPPEATSAPWLCDATRGVAHLHGLGLVHRDVKLENLLLDSAGRVRLCDLGWCAFEADRRTGRCGTPQLASPEVLRGEPHTSKMDVWALGAAMLQLFSGSPIAGPHEARAPRAASPAAQDLAEGLLRPDPGARLTARAALARPFLCQAASALAASTPPATPGEVQEAGCALATIRRPPAQPPGVPLPLDLRQASEPLRSARRRAAAAGVDSARKPCAAVDSARSERTEAPVLSTCTEFAVPRLSSREARPPDSEGLAAHLAVPTPCRRRACTALREFAAGGSDEKDAAGPAFVSSEVREGARAALSAARAARDLASEALERIEACRLAVHAAGPAARLPAHA